MFHLLFKVQTLAIVPNEIQPQGRTIPLDKHLEQDSWQLAASQNSPSRLSACAARLQHRLNAGIWVPSIPERACLNFLQKPGPGNAHKHRDHEICFLIISKKNPFTSTVLLTMNRFIRAEHIWSQITKRSVRKPTDRRSTLDQEWSQISTKMPPSGASWAQDFTDHMWSYKRTRKA